MHHRFSRRRLLAGSVALALPGTLGRGNTQTASSKQPADGVLFEEILPEASGVTWVHENAVSPEHHPPETLGPGCAFIDYDNDGWMDLFLVNSGPSDFYVPKKPLRH